ncbi:hypothetical protein Nepgr_030648 [Nepenthes gracilis]|uniref:RRM domain-containing protein n=1 Tax=Nepenthes gracilis TaxID=150966 RepID=A0AAD3TEZ8_NEPGR|nr:hypothetical protein Nepgr_030648 [Nepenthes gracilis]
MGKKAKEPEKNPSAMAESSSPYDSSNIFDKLFGEFSENEPKSLFSCQNPFRRKHSDYSQLPQNLGFGSVESNRNLQNLGSKDLSTVQINKRKKNEKKSEDFDADSAQNHSVNAVVGKKIKKGKLDGEIPRSENMGLRIDGENYRSGVQLNVNSENGMGDMSDKKKKRKRDVLEREYEARKYGVLEEEEDEKEGKKTEILVGGKRKTVDNPEEMVVSKDGYDDENKLLRTVFVGNLPLKVKKKALLREFSQFGEIESVRIRSVPTLDSKKPKKVKIIHNKINEACDSVHAYIVFKTEQSSEASLAHNMAVVGGNHIRVDRACPPRKKFKGDSAPLYDIKRTVFVGNLPFDVKDEELYQLFCCINQLESSVEGVRVIRDPHTSMGKGIAYILLKTREAASFIVKRKNFKLRDRDLRICRAQPNSTPTKREHALLGRAENSPAKRHSGGFNTTDSSSSKLKTNANASYQGLRATKSGLKNKGRSKTVSPVVVSNSGNGRAERLNHGKNKRPAVAARKAKAKVVKAGGNVNQGSRKRMWESQSPRSSHRSKKARKLDVN